MREDSSSIAYCILHLRRSRSKLLEIQSIQSSEIDAVNAQTLCFQFTVNFPSWMSPVRSRSPAPLIQQLRNLGDRIPGLIHKKIHKLRYIARFFQHLNRLMGTVTADVCVIPCDLPGTWGLSG